MTDPRSPLRTLRAALFAAVCVSLAAAGHSYTSGHHIPAAGLLTAFALATAIAWLAGGRKRGVPAVGAGMLAVQAGLHLIFGGAQQDAHHHAAAGPGTPMEAAAGGGSGMLAVHLLSGALCTLWLARGETAFLQLLRALDAVAFTPLRLLLAVVPVLGSPRPVRPHAPACRPLRGVLLAHALSRRGPPVPARSLATVARP